MFLNSLVCYVARGVDLDPSADARAKVADYRRYVS